MSKLTKEVLSTEGDLLDGQHRLTAMRGYNLERNERKAA